MKTKIVIDLEFTGLDNDFIRRDWLTSQNACL